MGQSCACDIHMKQIAYLAELVLELHYGAFCLVDRCQGIHHLLFILCGGLLVLIDGLQRSRNVGCHQRLHLLKRRENRSNINAELPMRLHRQNCKNCEQNSRELEQSGTIPRPLCCLGSLDTGTEQCCFRRWIMSALPKERLAHFVRGLLCLCHRTLLNAP